MSEKSTLPPRVAENRCSNVTSWQDEMKLAIRDARQLCQELDLPSSLQPDAVTASGDFSVFVPRPFLQRMERGNPHDPLLRQVLPVRDEFDSSPGGFDTDPVGDQAASPRPGLIHKYQGRALMVTTGACAVHCRYCFRRHFAYDSVPRSISEWQPALSGIADDASLHEIILSGGDPLTLSDGRLMQLVEQLDQIPHVQFLRIHTRLPVMIPQRVTSEFTELLSSTRLRTILVLHVNHAQEIDDAVASAVRKLQPVATLMLNQAVLLRGVNDSVPALRELSWALLRLGVAPYYLHQLDRVLGAAHFEVPDVEGRDLLEQLRQELPGYAVPRYVREIAGDPYKTPLM